MKCVDYISDKYMSVGRIVQLSDKPAPTPHTHYCENGNHRWRCKYDHLYWATENVNCARHFKTE